MPHPDHPRRRLSAFTLIELLTVIAIIGILAAIIIPTVSKVRETARNAKCVSQLREWGRVIQLYANDNKGNYAAADWASAMSGQGAYRDYFTKSDQQSKELRLCPANPNVAADIAANTQQTLRPTYAIVRGSIKGNVTNVAPDDKAVPLGKARNPSQYLLMMDSAPNDSFPITGNVLTGITTYIEPLTNNDPLYVNRHGGKMINAVFGDGSIKRITYKASRPGDPTAIETMRPTWFLLY